jgi:hypothetical protein
MSEIMSAQVCFENQAPGECCDGKHPAAGRPNREVQAWAEPENDPSFTTTRRD